MRKRVTTRIFAATEIRSCRRISFETAAAISGVRPGASAASVRPSPVAEQPVAKLAHREMRDRRERGGVVLVADQPRDFVRFVRDHRLVQERSQRQFGQRHLRGDALFGARAARPASSSPERAGEAFASSVFRSLKR